MIPKRDCASKRALENRCAPVLSHHGVLVADEKRGGQGEICGLRHGFADPLSFILPRTPVATPRNVPVTLMCLPHDRRNRLHPHPPPSLVLFFLVVLFAA